MYTFPIQIRFNDIDMLGHVNNVMYNHYFDMARYDYLKQTLGDLIDLASGQKILIMVHIENDFLQPSFLDDQIQVQTTLAKVGNRSLQLKQQIVDDQGNIRVSSLCVMSTFDRGTGRPFEIEEAWKERFK